MADDKTKIGAQDRARVAAGEPYEVRYFAGKHGLSIERAEQIIRENGPSREACDRAAETVKS